MHCGWSGRKSLSEPYTILYTCQFHIGSVHLSLLVGICMAGLRSPMSFSALCADSAHPPGSLPLNNVLQHHEVINQKEYKKIGNIFHPMASMAQLHSHGKSGRIFLCTFQYYFYTEIFNMKNAHSLHCEPSHPTSLHVISNLPPYLVCGPTGYITTDTQVTILATRNTSGDNPMITLHGDNMVH